MSGRKSKNKGARGEREFKKFLEDCGLSGIKRSGSAQGAGSSNLPDLISDSFSCEVKYRNKIFMGDIMKGILQAESASRGKLSYVAMRITGAPKEISGWFVVLRDIELKRFYRQFDIIKSNSKSLKNLIKLAKLNEDKGIMFSVNGEYFVIMYALLFCEIIGIGINNYGS